MKLKDLLKSKFARNVNIKLIALIIAGIASYLFYFILARILSVEDYGLLYSLIALTYFFTVPHETIRAVIAKYTINLAAKKQYGKIKGLLISSTKRILLYSFVAFGIFLLASRLLMDILHTSFSPLLIIGFSLIIAFVLPIIWGALQGMQYFGHLGLNNSIETAAKLIVAIALVYIGLGVNGALAAIPISMAVAFLFGFLPLRKIMKFKTEPFKYEKNIWRYSVAAFVIFAFFVAMYSVDMLAVRYFFSAKSSGLYSGISVIGKVVLFGSIAIMRVMFSAIAEEHSKSKRVSKETKKILYNAGFYVMIIIAFMLILSILFPEFLIQIILGAKYIEIAPLLKYMILAMGFLSLSSLIMFYNLSINFAKKLTARILGTFVFLQIALFIVFHQSLQQFVTVVLITNILLFLAMLATLIISFKSQGAIKK
jgi:O-antigen/teichoic acid export membrane protein